METSKAEKAPAERTDDAPVTPEGSSVAQSEAKPRQTADATTKTHKCKKANVKSDGKKTKKLTKSKKNKEVVSSSESDGDSSDDKSADDTDSSSSEEDSETETQKEKKKRKAKEKKAKQRAKEKKKAKAKRKAKVEVSSLITELKNWELTRNRNLQNPAQKTIALPKIRTLRILRMLN